ncbi:hypothetical protein CYG49_02970 [Candidatus Saccharibacteria bacterium]|nr:MAG: hypothetical protein CYG49_02970 [Candidatus Saccharibacteria bacterium]
MAIMRPEQQPGVPGAIEASVINDTEKTTGDQAPPIESTSEFDIPPTVDPTETKPRRSRRAGFVALGVAGAGIAAGIGWGLGRSSGGDTAPADRATITDAPTVEIEQPATSTETEVVDPATPGTIGGGELETSNALPDSNPEAETGSTGETTPTTPETPTETGETTNGERLTALSFDLDSLPTEEEAMNPRNFKTTVREMLGLPEGTAIGTEAYSDEFRQAILDKHNRSANYEITGSDDDLRKITLGLIEGMEKSANIFMTDNVVNGYGEDVESVGLPGVDISTSSSWLLPEGGIIDFKVDLLEQRGLAYMLLSDPDPKNNQLGENFTYRIIPTKIGEPVAGKLDQDGNGAPDSFTIDVQLVAGTGGINVSEELPRNTINATLEISEQTNTDDYDRWVVSGVTYTDELATGSH